MQLIIYIKQTDNANIIKKIFNIFKIESVENRTFIELPIDIKTQKRKQKHIAQKLCKFLYENNIRNVVLSDKIMQLDDFKNILYFNSINILDGTKLSKYLVINLIEKVYSYKEKRIEAGEVTFLVNDNSDIFTETITRTAQMAKRINIITLNTKKFEPVVQSLYEELGIIVKLSNNFKANLSSTDLIVNLDFPEEYINKINIPREATILNLPDNINIKSKKFAGINIRNWEIEVPNTYKIAGFNKNIVYEAETYSGLCLENMKKIQNDKIKIIRLIGKNGPINHKEFIKKM